MSAKHGSDVICIDTARAAFAKKFHHGKNTDLIPLYLDRAQVLLSQALRLRGLQLSYRHKSNAASERVDTYVRLRLESKLDEWFGLKSPADDSALITASKTTR